MQVAFLRTIAAAICSLATTMSYAQNTSQVSSGKCSPNASQIVASTIICIENLSPEQQKRLDQIKVTLEQIVRTGGPVQQKILLRLHAIATTSDKKLDDLALLYQESLKTVTNITPQLNRMEDVLSDLASRYYIVNIVPATPVPDLDPPVSVQHLQIASSGSTSGAATRIATDFIAKSSCKDLKFLPELQVKYLALLQLVAETESIDCNEKQYWYDIMPSMTDQQIGRLNEILLTERRQLEELNLKYQAVIKCLNQKHSFQWSLLEAKKKVSSSTAQDVTVQRAAVELLESGCPNSQQSEAASAIEALKATDVVVLTAEPNRAHLLSRLYSTQPFRNDSARVALLKIAYEREPDNWDYFSDYLRLLADSSNWAQILGMTKAAIGRNLMPELRINSEKHVARKLWLYWHYLNAATELDVKTEISNAAIVGYNLTRLLLERDPSESLLDRISFFSGHIWRSDAISSDLKSRYFSAIQDAAETMYRGSRLTPESFASRMLNLSWYCLVAKAPESSLRASEAGISANPKYLVLETNRAHALMQLGRKDDGLEIYRKYAGQQLLDGKTWNEVVVDDFEKLAKFGVQVVPKSMYTSVFR